MPVTSPPAVSIPDEDRIPQRDGSQPQGVYSNNADYWSLALNQSLEDFVALGGWTEGVANQTETWANESQASSVSSAASAISAASSANFKGLYSSLTGALAKPATVLSSGAYWALLNNLADVTLSVPSPSNPDWAFVSGTRWVSPHTASVTIAPNSLNTFSVTASPADITLATFATNDFFVIHNNGDTTQVVRIMNPSYTIRGQKGTATAGNNVILPGGDTVQLVALSATILEIV